MMKSEQVQGSIPPMVTPFGDDEELDVAAFVQELEYLLTLPVGGLLVGAATGEGYLLSDREAGRIVELAVDTVAGRTPVVAGAVSPSTRDAVARAETARRAGADAVLATPVTYFPPSSSGMIEHYKRIAEQGGLPVIVYDSMAHNPIAPSVVEALVEIDGVIGYKQGAGGNLATFARILASVGEEIAVTWAQSPLLFPAYVMGAVGSFSGMDSILPTHTTAMFAAVQHGDLDTARRLQREVSIVAKACARYSFPAAAKAAIGLQGRAVGRARCPYLPLADEEREHIATALASIGVLARERSGGC